MRKIKLYIAASIDGYIADINGELDWLSDYPITSELNYGYELELSQAKRTLSDKTQTAAH